MSKPSVLACVLLVVNFVLMKSIQVGKNVLKIGFICWHIRSNGKIFYSEGFKETFLIYWLLRVKHAFLRPLEKEGKLLLLEISRNHLEISLIITMQQIIVLHNMPLCWRMGLPSLFQTGFYVNHRDYRVSLWCKYQGTLVAWPRSPLDYGFWEDRSPLMLEARQHFGLVQQGILMEFSCQTGPHFKWQKGVSTD